MSGQLYVLNFMPASPKLLLFLLCALNFLNFFSKYPNWKKKTAS